MGTFLRFWFPLLGYSGIIFYISSIPSIPTPMYFPHADKIFHIGEYLPFGMLSFRALNSTVSGRSKHFLILAAGAMAFAYGITDEFHQTFVEGRSATAIDVLADTAGGLLGAWIFSLFIKRK